MDYIGERETADGTGGIGVRSRTTSWAKLSCYAARLSPTFDSAFAGALHVIKWSVHNNKTNWEELLRTTGQHVLKYAPATQRITRNLLTLSMVFSPGNQTEVQLIHTLTL